MSSDESEHLIDRRLARDTKTDKTESKIFKKKKSEKVESDSEGDEEVDDGVDANNTKDDIDPVASEEEGSDAPADIDEDQSEGHDYPDEERPKGHKRTSDETHEKRIGATVAEVETVEEDLSLPKGFVPITDMTRSALDHSTVAALKSKKGNELWLIKLPPNVEPESLRGQSIKFRASSGQVAILNKDSDSPLAVTFAPQAEFSRVVTVLPSKSAHRMNLGVPIDRQLTIVSAINTPALPPATAAQAPVKQVSDLRLRFLPIGSTKKTAAVDTNPMALILAKQKKTSSAVKDTKRKSTGDAPATGEKTKKPKQSEKAPSSLPSTPSLPPPKEQKKSETSAATPSSPSKKKKTEEKAPKRTPEQNGTAEKKEKKEKKEEKKKEEKKEEKKQEKRVDDKPKTPLSSEKKSEKPKTPTSDTKKDKKKDDKPQTPTSESKRDKKEKSHTPSSEGKKDKTEKDKEKRKTDEAASTPTKKQKS